MSEFIFPILSGSNTDLSKFDFSSRDIFIYNIQSADFIDYIKMLNPDLYEHNLRFVNKITKDINDDDEKKYAIVKGNIRKDFKQEELIYVYYILLIIFPSNLLMEHTLDFYDEDGNLECLAMTTWNKRFNEGIFGNPLICNDENLPEVNGFIKKYFDNFLNKNYIGISIENYLSSYSSSHYHYQYLALFIALESTVDGNTELNYRIKRTIAILCGDNEFSCKLIYDNLNKMYALRSKIVHGAVYDIEKVKLYINPLKAFVSRTIIELIVHNVESNKKLNERVTQIGYGDRNKISENWNYYKLNPLSIYYMYWKE